jgi:hypothetical protein
MVAMNSFRLIKKLPESIISYLNELIITHVMRH